MFYRLKITAASPGPQKTNKQKKLSDKSGKKVWEGNLGKEG
jgi:hypothetical protein